MWKIKKKVRVNSNGVMEECTMEDGKMENNMAKEHLLTRTVMKWKQNGSMENVKKPLFLHQQKSKRCESYAHLILYNIYKKFRSRFNLKI